jgi:hypothetical protein
MSKQRNAFLHAFNLYHTCDDQEMHTEEHAAHRSFFMQNDPSYNEDENRMATMPFFAYFNYFFLFYHLGLSLSTSSETAGGQASLAHKAKMQARRLPRLMCTSCRSFLLPVR